MQTEAIYDDGNIARPAAIEAWRGCPAGGRLVAFPTETVYGLGASAFTRRLRAVFEVKRRPADKPLLCHLFSLEQAEEIAYLTDEARALLRRYTPGPLTLVLKKKPWRAGRRFRRRRYGRAALSGQPRLPRVSARLRLPGGRAVGQSFVAAESGHGFAGHRRLLRCDRRHTRRRKNGHCTPSNHPVAGGERPELSAPGALPESELKALLGL